jgi:hypothetical protein
MNTTFTPPNLALRQDRFAQLREQEWAMAQKLLALASTLISRLRLKTDCASPSQIHALLELASRLARLSCAPPTDHLEPSPGPGGLPPEVQQALDRIYGPAAHRPVPSPLSPVPPAPGADETVPSAL